MGDGGAELGLELGACVVVGGIHGEVWGVVRRVLGVQRNIFLRALW